MSDSYHYYKRLERNQRVQDYFHASIPAQLDEGRSVHLDFSNVADKKALFEYLSEALNFPSYFGRNWDALNDVLASLDWIQTGGLVLVHDSFPGHLNEKDARAYLRCLRQVTERIDYIYWHRSSDLERRLIQIYRCDFIFSQEQFPVVQDWLTKDL